MNCPRCKANLKVETINDIHFSIEVDKCENCEGIWFDESELQKLERITELTIFEIRRIPRTKKQLESLFCPKCEDIYENQILMNKAEHPKDNKVVMDYCNNCRGIWLDKGELEAIQKQNMFRTLWGFLKNLHGIK